MMEELQRYGYDHSPSTCYSFLCQLRDAGYLSWKEEAVRRKRRKNLPITTSGNKVIDEMWATAQEVVSELVGDKDRRATLN